MSVNQVKYLIIGAGLSGLTSAYHLLKHGEEDFVVLEGRDRTGGRIHTINDIDLGATWFQEHHTELIALLDELGIGKFRQYSKGKGVFIYSSMAPAQYFESDESSSAFRIRGGSEALIESLSGEIENKIHLNARVKKVSSISQQIEVSGDSFAYAAEKVIFAMPPQLVSTILFDPELPPDLVAAMKSTHTWMSNSIKVGLSFKEPFWRRKQLSGTIIGHVCPTIELYDHSNYNDSTFSLMGFVNEGLRRETHENRRQKIIDHISAQLGKETEDYISYQEKDWSTDEFTSCDNLNSVYISPLYDQPLFQKLYQKNRIIFSGAETSTIHGGYMDGAIISGIRSAMQLLGQ